MEFNFTDIIDRNGTNAVALEVNPIGCQDVKEGFSKIPMWVADMNFLACPTIPEEMKKRADHSLYGYFITPDEYYDAIISWQKERNGIQDLKKENIGYENGVLGGLMSALGILASFGDNVLVHSPTYVGFTKSLKNKGYNIIHSSLYKDETGVWSMDYEDMDKKIKDNNIHVAIFCSPHNPTGRVWKKEEIEKAFEVYRKNNVYVIADEIWSDIILFGNKHIPSQSINEDAKNRTITLCAPSKTFNLAGLVGAYHIIYNPYLKDRMIKESSLSHYNNANVMSVAALLGAYKEEGKRWIDELRVVLGENIEYGWRFIEENFKGLSVQKPEGTYLLYIDSENWCINRGKTHDELLKKGVEYGVMWQDGRLFGLDYTIRMNLALPKTLVIEAFERLDKYVFNGNW